MKQWVLLWCLSIFIGVGILAILYGYRFEILANFMPLVTNEKSLRDGFISGEIPPLMAECKKHPEVSDEKCRVFANCMATAIDRSLTFDALKQLSVDPARLVHQSPYKDIIVSAAQQCLPALKR